MALLMKKYINGPYVRIHKAKMPIWDTDGTVENPSSLDVRCTFSFCKRVDQFIFKGA